METTTFDLFVGNEYIRSFKTYRGGRTVFNRKSDEQATSDRPVMVLLHSSDTLPARYARLITSRRFR